MGTQEKVAFITGANKGIGFENGAGSASWESLSSLAAATSRRVEPPPTRCGPRVSAMSRP